MWAERYDLETNLDAAGTAQAHGATLAPDFGARAIAFGRDVLRRHTPEGEDSVDLDRLFNADPYLKTTCVHCGKLYPCPDIEALIVFIGDGSEE